jgi:hypothetical protein
MAYLEGEQGLQRVAGAVENTSRPEMDEEEKCSLRL